MRMGTLKRKEGGYLKISLIWYRTVAVSWYRSI